MSEHDNDLLDKLVSSLRLHGARQEWSTLDEAVHEAALRLRIDRELINELHSILGTVPHEFLTSRARAVAARIRDLEAALREAVGTLKELAGDSGPAWYSSSRPRAARGGSRRQRGAGLS